MNNLCTVPWRWLSCTKNAEEDITNRKFILWGCGKYIQEFTSDLQLDDFSVIDGNPDKQGQSILLNNKQYLINSPDILNDLDINAYYIVITVQNEEIISAIKKLINTRYPCWSNSVCECNELKREYDSILSACVCDPFIHNKIYEGRLSAKLPEYIETANKILESNLGLVEKMYFSVIRYSSRIIFLVRYENHRYLLHLPYNKSFFSVYSENNVRQIYEIRKRLHINENLIIYEDLHGFMLSRYMESDEDFSDHKLAKKVLDNIKSIHNSNEKIDAKMTLHNGIEELEKNVMRGQEKNNKWFCKIHNAVIPETKIYNEKLIHGDLSYGNVLHDDNRIEIIDWTFMEMGDPMFDVCLFYYYISLHWYYDFYEVICMYYDRQPTNAEYKHALAWLILITYWKFLEEVEKYGQNQNEIYEKFKKFMDEY